MDDHKIISEVVEHESGQMSVHLIVYPKSDDTDRSYVEQLSRDLRLALVDRNLFRDDLDRAYAALGLNEPFKPNPTLHHHIQIHRLAGIVAWGLRQLGLEPT